MTTAQRAGENGEEMDFRPPGKGITGSDGYWLVLHPGHESTGAPLPRLACGGSVLPVYGSREDAAESLGLLDLSGRWRIGTVGAGEFLAILLGPPCAGVETVALDPIPGISEEVSARLVGIGAGHFALHLARRRTEEVA